MNGEQIGIWHCSREGFTADSECSDGGWHRPEDLVLLDAETTAEALNAATDVAARLGVYLAGYHTPFAAHEAFERWQQLTARLGVDR